MPPILKCDMGGLEPTRIIGSFQRKKDHYDVWGTSKRDQRAERRIVESKKSALLLEAEAAGVIEKIYAVQSQILMTLSASCIAVTMSSMFVVSPACLRSSSLK